MLNLGSTKPLNPENGNSILSPLSVPPSLQYDLRHQSNLKSSSISHPERSALRNVNSLGNRPLLHDNGNFNMRGEGEFHTVFPCRPPMTATNWNSSDVYDDLDSLRAFVNRTDFMNESGRSSLFQKGLINSPSSNRNGEFHGLTNNVVLEASSQTSSSTPTKQPSFVSGCPRVFCMGANGDLLLSNTGLFGIFCSCHGMRMSVLKFCEHSGLFDVNPGYAVRMESGECIAQWRKVYLHKFRIMAPEDHKGWDWPEETLPTSHVANSKMAVADRRKVFDLSGLFTSSVESVTSTQPWKNVPISRALSSKENANQVPKDPHQKYGCDQTSLHMSLMRSSGRYSDTVTESPQITSSSPSCLTASEAPLNEKLQNGSQSSSFNFNNGNSNENLPGSVIQTSQSIGSKNRNLKDDTAKWRSNLPSSIELKLGQPSQLGWGSAFSSSPKAHFIDVRATAVQEKLTSNRGNSKVTESTSQYTASNWSRTKEQIQPSLLDSAPRTAHGSSPVVTLNDGLANTILVPSPSSNNSGEKVLFHKEIEKATIVSRPLIPSSVRYHPNMGKSSLIDLSCNGNTPTRPLATSKLVLQKNKNRTVDPRDGNKDLTGSGSSFKLYAKQVENFGFLTSYDNHPNVCRIPTEQICSAVMPSLLSGMSGASTYSGDTFSHQSYPDRDRLVNGPKTSLTGSEANPALQTVALAPGHGFLSFNKGVDASSSHMPGERLSCVPVKNLNQSVNGISEEVPPGLNQQPKTRSDRREQSISYISDMEMPDSFLNRGPLEGHRNKHCHPPGRSAAPTFLSDLGLGKGTNSLEPFGASSRKNTVDNQGPCDAQPEQRCGRCLNKACNCALLQRGPYAYNTTDLINCTIQMTCANRESHCKSSSLVNTTQKQVSITTINPPRLSGTISPDDVIPLEKDNAVVCNPKRKEQVRCKPNWFSSQWRDVPSRTATGSKKRCLDAPAHLSKTRGDFETHVNELPAKGFARSNQASGLLKGKEMPISSGCSIPAVTEASSEVNRIESCTFNGGNPGYVVDEGSVIMRSSSVDSIDSVKSSQPDSNMKPMISETVSSITAHHGQNDDCRQMNSESNELQNLGILGASLEEKEKHVDNFQCRKRKDNLKWSMLGTPLGATEVSLSTTKYQLPAGIDVDHQRGISECVQVRGGNSYSHGLKKRRSTLCQVKLLSRKRELHGKCDFLDYDRRDQTLLKRNDESTDIPVDTTVKRLKMTTLDVTLKKQGKATKDLSCSWLSSSKSDETSRCRLKRSTMARPVACGKYGIICDQELDIDQLKPPKIVPLSQILKVSKRCTENQSSFRFSEGNKVSNVSSNTHNRVLSLKDGDSDASIHETQQRHNQGDGEHTADDLSILEEVEASGSKRNLPMTLCRPASQSKTKESRIRNLYELSMRGNKFISSDSSLSQNVMCAPSKRISSENTGESDGYECRAYNTRWSSEQNHCHSLTAGGDALCCVCGISNKDDFNCLLECACCLIRIHQACYGISRVPKGEWLCRPCRTNSKDVACVLCGYGGGAMTRAFGSRNVVKTLLKAWNIRTESHIVIIGSAKPFYSKNECGNNLESSTVQSVPTIKPVVHNCIIAGLFNPTVKQWVHMVCGLWTSGTRCPNVDTMSAFDVSGVHYPNAYVVCCICNRSGGSCIKCRIETCCAHFHPWCAHQKGLLQSEVEGVDSDQVGFYGRCLLHASNHPCVFENDDVNNVVSDSERDQQPTCARTEAYQGKRQEGRWPRSSHQGNTKGGCLVTQVQLDAWDYINRHKLSMRRKPNLPISDVEHDYRKEYARFKVTKGWKSLVVYKSGIHALGLYTSQFIPRGAMVVEYIGEIVGLRVADKRETEYLSGRKLQYKSACYFFKIDKEHIIDATCKGGIARFVNHSCQPNCIAKVITIRSQKKVVFFAQKDICPGEEITYDYHFNHEDEGKKIPCFCNSKNCRRYLN
ncbi:uncharacterized protein LOC141600301 isoform X2 [Silene latifolia]|uniref:uncharacterized protein LOC141600301 isoform X2 n=1 Tax=Silene latifolia TaxID=37657 RepID=UPI003D77654A